MHPFKNLEVALTPEGMELSCILPDIDKDECRQWELGNMRCGIFRYHNQGYIVLDNGLGMTWAAGINIFLLKGRKLFEWLQLSSGIVGMQLIEQNSMQQVCFRSFEFPQSLWLFLITLLRQQYQFCKNKATVDKLLVEAMDKWDAYAMMEYAAAKGLVTDI